MPKADTKDTKPRTSIGSKAEQTPARKRWFDILRPAIGLGRRRPSSASGLRLSAAADTSTADTSLTTRRSSTHACVALQTDDPTSDAVVITALPTLPFCCHADLLAMDRAALFRVAHVLNTQLPAALNIDVSGARTLLQVRTDIEMLVGIRRAVPDAPVKAVRKRPYEDAADGNAQGSPTPPASPLANKSRSQDLYGAVGNSRLERLVEEEEPTLLDPPRVFKKRRVTDENASPAPEATRLTRAQSHGGHRTSRTNIVKGKAVQRSVSVNLPGGRTTVIDTAFVTTTRPRYQFRYSRELVARASTAKKSSNQDGKRAARGTDSGDYDTSADAGVKRKRSVDEQPDDEREDEITFGIDGMTMAISPSDSDMSIEI